MTSAPIPTPLEEMLRSGTAPRSISIGLPAGRTAADHRFPLTPEGASRLVERGYEVKMEAGAAEHIHYSDEAYMRRGVTITTRREALAADVVIALSRLSPEDARCLKRGGLFLGYLNAETPADAAVLRVLLERHVVAIALDKIETRPGRAPFAEIVHEVGGRAALSLAASLLADAVQGKGILLGGVPGVVPCEVMIVGTDTAAIAAASTAIGLGAIVRMFDNDIDGLRDASRMLGPALIGSAIHPKVFENALRSADIIVTTRLSAPTPWGSPEGVIGPGLAELMKRGVICFDLTDRPGSAFPSLRLVDLNEAMPGDNPMGGPVRYCYINASNAVPRTLAMALSNTFVNVLDELLVCGQEQPSSRVLRLNAGLRKGVYTFYGKCVNQRAARAVGVRAVDINFLIQFSS